MATYRELLVQKAALDAQVEKVREEERGAIIIEIRQKMNEYQITVDEIGGGRKGKKSIKTARSAVAPKYQDPATGATWSGRGKAPHWIKDTVNRDKFLIS